MAIGAYIKEIGRGKDGARALTREQAADLMGQVLDGKANDLEIGAFCLAMRIKGETALEMAGFLDAAEQRLARLPAQPEQRVIVLPSYNGARRLPALLPLLALLLARQGFAVLVHGSAGESRRVFTSEIFAYLGVPARTQIDALQSGEVHFVPTQLLHPGLQSLLDVRRSTQLRNPGHSMVKLLLPCQGKTLLVTSYTHPEYALSMQQVLALRGASALLLRGTEGEPVADQRRRPDMTRMLHGHALDTQRHEAGSLHDLPAIPQGLDAAANADYVRAMLDGSQALPEPIAHQLQSIAELAAQL